MKEKIRILAVNPGSTSTKIALYENDNPIYAENLFHPAEEIRKYGRISDQYEFRRSVIMEAVKEHGTDLNEIDAIVGRGGNMKPVQGGTYLINEAMLEDLKIGVMGQHASNLGGIIADAIARPLYIPSYVVDPVVVDEFEELARVSGIPEIQRKSKDHPLNQKAAARKAAAEMGKDYSELNFVVAHMGGGISVGAHKRGRIIDVNNALDGDGAFSPERSGGVPVGALVEMCFSGKFTKAEVLGKITGSGGLVAYLGTNDGREVQRRIKEGDRNARLIYEAMAYQVSKDIGAAAAVLKGDVAAVVLTGGVAYDEEFVSWINDRVGFIAPVKVYPGENEMIALVQGVLRVFRGEEAARIYG
ncbi:MAG: butyrate kinase [Pseudomonadota bacterium]